MRTSHRRYPLIVAVLICVLTWFLPSACPQAAPPGVNIVQQLQERLGLNERQVRGALGALLVFAREQLPKPEFDDFAASIPNAERAMEDVKLQGIVTRPLDDIDDYEASLASLGIGQPLASQFAPTVEACLGAAGFSYERDILRRVLD